AFGHDGYLNADALAAAGTGRLMLNAVRWAGGGRVAVHRLPDLLKFLQGQGVQAETMDDSVSAERLKPFGLLCCKPSRLPSESVSAVAGFVKSGGGLVAAETGWGWLQLHPGQNLGQNHGNVLLAPAGIVWTDGTLERTSAAGFRVGGPPSPLCHAARALDALKSPQNADETALAVWTVSRAVRALPADDALLRPRLRELIEGQQEAIPTKQTPVTMKAPLARLALTLQMEEMKRLPLDKVQAHPAAAAFPGSVPADAQKVSRSVECDATVPGWHSTGLYAPPGQVITVEIPAAAAKGELQLRLGAHSDRLWDKDSWWRCPEVTASFPLDKPLVQAASAFGGLIYVDVPKGSKLGTAAVTIRDAVEAPHFVLGKTTLADWREKIRQRPAPWAELESSKVILTVPSTALRGLDDPEELMKFWDKVLDACAELAGLPLERERPERYVADVQISAGYMHSGYPIMTHLDAAAVMVDKPRMIREGAWGLFHEMGHNHQSPDWTFAGTGEVTCNLFTLYVLDTVCHTANRHPALSAASRAKKLGEHFA
ncbi:MAG: hypothetical protein FJ272_21510, partial [Planctomycetes bacterium]|nr:hypothetical protein [Planctomycetota bacterium]